MPRTVPSSLCILGANCFAGVFMQTLRLQTLLSTTTWEPIAKAVARHRRRHGQDTITTASQDSASEFAFPTQLHLLEGWRPPGLASGVRPVFVALLRTNCRQRAFFSGLASPCYCLDRPSLIDIGVDDQHRRQPYSVAGEHGCARAERESPTHLGRFFPLCASFVEREGPSAVVR